MTAPPPRLAFASVIFDRIREAEGTKHPPVAPGPGGVDDLAPAATSEPLR